MTTARKFPYLLLLISLVTSYNASAQRLVPPIDPRVTHEGQILISGQGIGCVSLVQAKVVVPYIGVYDPPPDFQANTSVDNGQDSVEINSIDRYSNRTDITTTTNGSNHNQVCAGSYINYTVQSMPGSNLPIVTKCYRTTERPAFRGRVAAVHRV